MSETKSELERVYTVPLSRAWIAPRHQRTKRAVNILKEYAEKHMKSSEIKIETSLNEELWNRGITSPPRRITVKMKRDEDGVVTISLPKEKKELKEEEPSAPQGKETTSTNESSSSNDSDSQKRGTTSLQQNDTPNTDAKIKSSK